MSDIRLPYKFYYWGPLLCKFKVSPEELKQLKKLCKKNKKFDHRKELAGVIENEYTINRHAYQRIISPYLQAYTETIYSGFYGRQLNKLLEVSAVWVNYMKPGECNPPHISSSLYIQIPPELKKEQEDYIGRGAGPGAITFNHGYQSDFTINTIHEWPEEGDFYIFPYNLSHFVASYKTKKQRISIAANFNYI